MVERRSFNLPTPMHVLVLRHFSPRPCLPSARLAYNKAKGNKSHSESILQDGTTLHGAICVDDNMKIMMLSSSRHNCHRLQEMTPEGNRDGNRWLIGARNGKRTGAEFIPIPSEQRLTYMTPNIHLWLGGLTVTKQHRSSMINVSVHINDSLVHVPMQGRAE
ncbi:sporulation protein [Anopheles sinensis]|uniref:Sporulation protein n=1 Tax=Anopheles sinensis TaxID=74873 RepID=A0A084WSQ0_ANOSI|nr:sporulation protein [Anopheles sinensis]